MPLTQDRPKGMVVLAGLPLLAWQVAVMRRCGIRDISLVGGYRAEMLRAVGLPVILNESYAHTNMVESLMRARALFDGRSDLIMAYGDIVYEPRVLRTLLHTPGEVVVAADREWQMLWSARMDDSFRDVESFRLRADGSIAELGRRPESVDDVDAQYIGLVRFQASCHERLLALYDALDRAATYDGQPFQNMYMTTFLQLLIDRGWNVRAALVERGWLEIDTADDLRRYERLSLSGELDALCRLEPPPEPKEIIARLRPSVDAAPFAGCDIGMLATRLADSSTPDAETLEWLDRVARKIEITGTLHRRYVLAGVKAEPVGRLATPEESAALLAAYLVVYDGIGDPRHLNTVLKALGGTLHSPKPAMCHELDYCCARRLGERA